MSTIRSQDLPNLTGDDAERVAKLLSDLIRPAVEASVAPAIGRFVHQTGYSEEVAGLVSLLAARSNDSRDEVLRKALTLYGLALDALEKGNRVAILNGKDQILHDVIGLDGEAPPVANAAG